MGGENSSRSKRAPLTAAPIVFADATPIGPRAQCGARKARARRGRTASEGEDGAQGRNRTTDTAIFSRMLYQLSYLGAEAL